MSGFEKCDAPFPKNPSLSCLKPKGHENQHATCLGYHPEPYDVYEWAEWTDTDDRVLTSDQ